MNRRERRSYAKNNKLIVTTENKEDVKVRFHFGKWSERVAKNILIGKEYTKFNLEQQMKSLETQLQTMEDKRVLFFKSLGYDDTKVKEEIDSWYQLCVFRRHRKQEKWEANNMFAKELNEIS